MSRLESIKELWKNFKVDDIQYMLQSLERYETALKEVTVSTSHNHAKYVADKVIKEP